MLNQLTIRQLTATLAKREVSARQALEACLAQVGRVDNRVQAFLSHDADDAFAQADAADKAIASGNTHAQQPLLGVPIALKDVLAVKGHPLGCASRILRGFISPYDATAVEKLKQAGAILFGRLADGRRFLANTPDDARLLQDMVDRDMIGTRGRVTNNGGRNTFSPG